MSRWLRFTIVLAAAAFVVGFRFSADGNDADAGPLNTERARVVQSDGGAAAKQAASAPARLAQVVELPKLATEPASRVAAREKKEAAERKARAARRKAAQAREKRAAARRKKAAAARRRAAAAARRRAASSASSAPRTSATPAPTVVRPAPTPVYRAPVTPAPQKKSGYVGKDFDSEG